MPMIHPLRTIILLATLCVTFLVPLNAQDAAAPTDGPTGAGIVSRAWPKSGILPLAPSVRFELSVEKSRDQVFRIAGRGLSIVAPDIAPFFIDETAPVKTGWRDSAILYDSRSKSAFLAFTHFEKGAFLSKVDPASVKGYAAWLVSGNDPAKAVSVGIVAEPALLDRRATMLRSKPVFLTWRRSDRNAGVDVQRTDYFFPLADGSLLVASVVAAPDEEANVRTAAANVLRFASIGENDASEP